MIGLSSPVFDPAGAFLLNESNGSNFDDTSRRMRKRATLDGGVVVSDAGHSYGDSTWQLTLENPSKSIADALERLLRVYQTLTLTTKRGAFTVAPARYRFNNDTITLTLEVIGAT